MATHLDMIHIFQCVLEGCLQFQYALLGSENATCLINLPQKCLQSALKGCVELDLKAF